MPATRINRPTISKKAHIPGGFILNWQSSQAKGTKPLVRRPVTACDNCRAAKVKCDNGQPECEHCTRRGILCKYNAVNLDTRSVNSNDTTDPANPLRHETPQDTLTTVTASTDPHSLSSMLPTPPDNFSDDMPMDLNSDMFDGLCGEDFLSMGASDNLIEWSYELGEQLSQSRVENENPVSDCQIDSTPTQTKIPLTQNQSATYMGSQHQPQILQAFQTLGGDCQCRELLLTQVPRVRRVMQQQTGPKLGNVFKVTQEVIQNCQNLIECTHCQLNWSDVLCIVAVFQSTQACFKCLANADTDDVIKVSVDDCEIALCNNTTLRRLMVMDLLKRASHFLAALKMLGANIMKKELPFGSLCRINLHFLNSATSDCEAILQSVRNSVDGNSDGSHAGADSSVEIAIT